MKAPYTLLATVAAVALVGCQVEDDNNKNTGTIVSEIVAPNVADVALAIATSDYTTSTIAVASKKNSDTVKLIEQLAPNDNPSDMGISISNGQGYRLGKYKYDHITKFSWDISANKIDLEKDSQFSVLGADTDANPYTVVELSDSKAYVVRYDAKELWEVNPSATTEADFKIDEIDLSDFAHSAGKAPQMNDAVLVGDKLYVLLEKLNKANFSAPEQNSVLVIVDTTDNSLVDTDPSTSEIDAIDLTVRNANGLITKGDNLLVSAKGDAYGATYYGRSLEEKFTGGIVEINTSTYEVNMLLDDGDVDNAPYGNITRATIADSGDIYFIGNFSLGNDKLYRLVKNSGIGREITLGEGTFNLSALNAKGNDIYVGVQADETKGQEAGIHVITDQDQSEAFIELTLNPTQIEIIE